MNTQLDIVGKTVTGIIAAPGGSGGPTKIWMMQFSDGSHVEFVSPKARKQLIRAAGHREHANKMNQLSPQLALNVA
jgi:hypothetical protein